MHRPRLIRGLRMSPIIDDSKHFFAATTWAEYKASRRLSWMLFFGGPPVVLLLGGIPAELLEIMALFWVVAIPWMIAWYFVSMRAVWLLCPRCGKRFFTKGWFTNTWAKRCMHCGLPKWSEPDAAPPTNT